MAEAPLPRDPAAANPLGEIWLAGRTALLRAARDTPEQLCLGLAAAGGVIDVFTRFVVAGRGRPTLAQLGLGLILAGPVWGVLRVYGLAWTVFLMGRPLGGTATLPELRAAVVWSTLPRFALLALWVPGFLVLGRELFTLQFYTAQGSGAAALVALVVGLSVVIVTGAELILLDAQVATVQGFTRLRALGNIVLAGLCIGITLMATVYLWLQIRAFEHAGAGA